MKRKKTLLLIGIGATVVIFIALLPTILSSDYVLRALLARINKDPESTLNIGTCTLGWRKGLTCSSIEFSNGRRGLHLLVDRISADRGLLALIAASKNLGTIRIQHPVVTLSKHQAVSATEPQESDENVASSQPEAATEEAVPPDKAYTSKDIPFWDSLGAAIVIEDGRMAVEDRQKHSTVLGGAFSGTSSLANGTIKYELQWRAGEGQGTLQVVGFVNLPARKQNILDTIVANGQFHASDLQISPFMAMVADDSNLPTGEGVVNGKMNVTIAGRDKLDMIGNLECTDIRFSGGILGQDQPWMEKVSLHLDGSKSGRNDWRLSEISLDGDLGQVSANGMFTRGNGQGKLTADIRLPVLFSQFPHLLRTDQGTFVEAGDLKLVAEISRKDSRQGISAEATVNSMEGLHNNQSFIWDVPVNLELTAEQSEEGVNVDRLLLETSFLQVNGNGTVKDLTFEARADLTKATEELGNLFALQWSGKGLLSLLVTSRLTDEDQFTVNLQVDSPEVTVTREEQLVLPPHPLQLKGTLNGTGVWLQNKGNASLQVDATLWPGSFSLTVNDLQRSGPSFNGEYDLATRLNLNHLTSVYHNLQALSGKTTFGGDLNLNAAGFFSPDQVVLRDLDLQATDFSFQGGDGIDVQEKHLVLSSRLPIKDNNAPIGIRKLLVTEDKPTWQAEGSGFSAFDRAGRKLFLRDLKLQSDSVDLDLGELIIHDLRQPLQGWHAEIKGQADLGRITALAREAQVLPEDLKLRGQSHFTLSARQLEPPQMVSLDLSMPQCSLEFENKTVFEKQKVRAALRLGGVMTKGDLKIHVVELDSPPLGLQAQGRLLRNGNNQLFLKGNQTIDSSEIGRLLQELTGTKVVMQGRHQDDFELEMPFPPKAWTTGRFSSGLKVDSLDLAGISTKQVSLPLALDNGSLHIGAHGMLNDGRLDVDSTYVLNKSPHITVSPGQVLKNIRIDKPLTENVLAKIHPLFGVLAKPTGTVTARLNDFYWPVAEKGELQARFTTVFDTSAIQLDSRGILREILRLFKINDKNLKLKESEITCNGKEGRISCTPLRILVADSEMTISGSVGMDQSLEYLLEVPVSERLVGREGFRVLEGATIKVPLRGRLNDPEFDRNLVKESVSDLMGQAAGKVIEKQAEKLLPGLFNQLQL